MTDDCVGSMSTSEFRNLVYRQARQAQQVAAREVAALTYLNEALSPVAWIPGAGGWACSYEALASMVDELLAWDSPGDVIETGSGVSTVWLGLAMRELGRGGRLMALEHDPKYAERTRRTLVRHGLDDICNVVDAPLDVADGWYSLAGLDLPTSCRLLLVDGPPGAGKSLARKPAYARLRHALVQNATVVVDDISRADEAIMVRHWQADELADAELTHLGDFGDAGFYRYVRR